MTADMMRSLFETNVFCVVRVTHAFLPLLRRSAAPVVVNVSSGLAASDFRRRSRHACVRLPGS